MYGSYSRRLGAQTKVEVDALARNARKAAEYVKEHDGIELKTLHSLFGEAACNFAVELRACYRSTQDGVTRYFTNL